MTIEDISLRPQRMFFHESDFGTPAANFLWQKMINNQKFVEQCFPIGYILFFYGSQTFASGPLLDKPNPEIWQLLDGSTITDADSPLFGVTLPNFSNKFLKGSETEGLTGGQSTVNIRHSHGGQTGTTDDRLPYAAAQSGSNNASGSPHYHSIDSQWSTSENVIPPFVEIQMYVRIK